MGRFVARLVIVSAMVSACNALTGADDLRLDDGTPNETHGSSGSASTSSGASGTAVNDAGTATNEDGASNDAGSQTPPGDSGPTVDPANVIFESPFDVASDCSGWTGTGTRTHDPAGRTKPGSCRLCAPNGGDVMMSKTGKTPHAGKMSASAWARRVENASAPPSFGFVVSTTSANLTTTQSFAGPDWTRAGNGTTVSVPSGEAVTVRISFTASAGATCILVDDVLAVVE